MQENLKVYERIIDLCKQKNISVRRLEMDLDFSNGQIKKIMKKRPQPAGEKTCAKKAGLDYGRIFLSDSPVQNQEDETDV